MQPAQQVRAALQVSTDGPFILHPPVNPGSRGVLHDSSHLVDAHKIQLEVNVHQYNALSFVITKIMNLMLRGWLAHRLAEEWLLLLFIFYMI